MLPRRSHSRTVRRGRLCVFLSVEKLRGRRERGKVRLSLQGSYFVGGSLEQSTSSMTWRTARWTPVASTLVALAAAWGCGNGSREPPRLPVSGTVTLDWRPLKSGQIRFQRSPSGPVSQAETSIIDGRYSISRDEGLVPGTYRVTICFASSGAPGDGAPRTPSLTDRTGSEEVPSTHTRNATFQAEVKNGADNVFSYDLKIERRREP